MFVERRLRALTVSNLPPKSMFAAAAVAAATEVSGDALLLSAPALLFSSQGTHRWTRVTPTLTHSQWAPKPSKHTKGGGKRERAPVWVVRSSTTLHASLSLRSVLPSLSV